MGLRVSKYKARPWFIAGEVTVVTLLLGILTLVHFVSTARSSLPKQASLGGVVLTAQLLTTIEKLQTSLEAPLPSTSGDTTATYIAYMNDLEKSCGDFQIYASDKQGQAPKSDTSVYITKSIAMCNQLVPLASNSRALYQAALPILEINPHVKRYQTLPIVSGMVRTKQLATVSKSKEAITAAAATMKYPTKAVSLVSQLQTDMQASQKLAYTTALTRFQNDMLAERQRYWLSYNELQNLQSTLKLQLSRYCTNVSSTSATRLSECRQSHNS